MSVQIKCIEKVVTKVRATVILTRTACGASRWCLMRYCVIGHNCTLATSTVAEWFDCA